jgi:predicted NAD-dependent protein-ADP-ribosyltransferase YbiA (DUF1768 family)
VDRLDEIAWSFVDRPPNSVAGVAALLAYAAESEADGNEWPDSRHYFSATGQYLGCESENWSSSILAAVAPVLKKAGVRS